MIPLTLKQLASWCDGELLQGVPSAQVKSISTDSRKVGEGEIFLALKGDRFDGHDFIGSVAERKAGVIVVSNLTAETESFSGGIVRVKDTLNALQRLAFNHRRKSGRLFVVGITGSNGKTSTKDFLGVSLSAAGQVNHTVGNLNNHIGLPLTILAGHEDDKFGVWEMGMNHPGEIELLAEISRPDAAIITHVGTAHIEHMKTREAIAEEKSALAIAVPARGYCAMPVADDFFEYVSDRVSCELISVGIGEGDVRAEAVEVIEGGQTKFVLRSDMDDSPVIVLPVGGFHMVNNALLAAAVAIRQGIAPNVIAEKLGQVELSGGRLQEIIAGGIRFLDDSYNANPDSVKAALETLKISPVGGRRVAVLGFMGELGEHEREAHLSVGGAVVKTGVDALVTVGARAALINEGASGIKENHHFADHGTAFRFLRKFLGEDDLVLVKGSRAAAMEKVINHFN